MQNNQQTNIVDQVIQKLETELKPFLTPLMQRARFMRSKNILMM